jgi:hypothetical protein
MRYFVLSFVFVFGLVPVAAQCDSAAVGVLMDSLRKDTMVCKERYPCKGMTRRLFADPKGSYTYYDVVDTAMDVQSRWTYYNMHLYLHEYSHIDTMFETRYDSEGCYVISTAVEVHNDSLSTSEEGGAVYDYYRDICYDEYGRKTGSETWTLVTRKGKAMQRVVKIRYWKGIAIRRSVYYCKAGYT